MQIHFLIEHDIRALCLHLNSGYAFVMCDKLPVEDIHNLCESKVEAFLKKLCGHDPAEFITKPVPKMTYPVVFHTLIS